MMDTNKVISNILNTHENKRVIFGDRASKGKADEDYCKLCGLKVGKHNVYDKKGCSECAYMNDED